MNEPTSTKVRVMLRAPKALKSCAKTSVVNARRGDDGAPRTGDHRGPHEEVVGLLGQGSPGAGLDGGLLARFALARQGGLDGREAVSVKELGVSRDDVAGLEHEEVAHHHLRRRHEGRCAVALHPGSRRRQRAEGQHRGLRAKLLHEADDGVHDDDGGDGNGFDEVPERARDGRRRHEEPDERRGELAGEQLPPRSPRRLLQGVRPVGGEPGCGGRPGESARAGEFHQ